MHSVLGWKTWLMAALTLCAGLIAAQLALGVSAGQAVLKGVSWTSLAATVFVASPLWRFLWLVPWFRRRAPPLDGVWTGEVLSNWSVVQALKDAAKQSGDPPVDVDAVYATLPPLATHSVTATIETSFFKISLELESQGTRYQTSTLKVAELKPAVDGQRATLHYIFEGRVLEPRPGDVTCFDGAASLSILVDGKGGYALEGPTWNNRAWARGVNTAGVIRMKPVEQRFWRAATFGLLPSKTGSLAP